MGKRLFRVTVTVEAELELDDMVIAAVDDSWREQFYRHVIDGEDVANYVGFNMVLRDAQLTDIDGFANLENGMAQVVPGSVEEEVESEEITPRRR